MTDGLRSNDSVRAVRRRRRASGVVVPLFVFALAWIGACGNNETDPHLLSGADSGAAAAPPGNACGPGAAGCACTKESSVASCGRVDSRDGNYVTCSMGYSTCSGGTWGACIGDHLVTRSLPNIVMTAGGIHTLSPTYPSCANVCDPNGCMSTLDNPGDVDAAGIQPGADGGIMLQDATVPIDAGCFGLACQIAACGGTLTTTLSGVVYDPAGNNPLYNAAVYIPAIPGAALPAFTTGATCDTCGGAGALSAIQATQTDAAGNFTLTNVPTIKNLPIVVQLGKWRREIVLKTITSCTNNAIAGNCTTANPADCVFRLPRNHTDGYDPVAGTYSKADLPHVAIATGASDPFDCLLLKAGVDAKEFGDYTSSKRFHFYEADGTGGGDTLDPAYGMNVPGSTFWNNLNGAGANMSSYDVILLPCEGAANDKQGASANTPYQNVITYANAGGRAFMTHFGYSWLEFPAGKHYVAAPDNWSTLANWAPTGAAMTGTIDTQDPMTGIVNTTFPKGAVYSQWLQNLGATNVPSQLTIHEGRQDLTTLGASAQTWMAAHDKVYATAPDYTNLFTFNTPLLAPATAQCGRVVYSDFHVSASALVGSTNQCIADVDCGVTATCGGSKPGAVGQCAEACGTSADCPNGSFACAGATAGTCGQTACTSSSNCGTGRACVGGVCGCTGDSDCNGGGCGGAACTAISCTSSAQCGAGTCGGGSCNSVACHKTSDCGLGACGGTGHTGTCAGGTVCHSSAACGIGGTCGAGTSSTAGTCTTTSLACHKNADCDSASCGVGTSATLGTCANGIAHVCHVGSDCDSGSCGSASGSTAGACSILGGIVCHKTGDCDSASCGSGSGSTAGTCSTSATVCHTNAQCDSNACGSGTGSTTGVCSILGGTTCHKIGDCDSNSCGTGTGSTAGTCSTSAVVCHKATDCDSNSCGAGTGSTVGTCSTSAAVCHTNAQCDSNSCGVGVGSATGTCANGAAAICHANADCDSGSCGAGGGSTAGTCSTGLQTCHSAAQCDSGSCGGGVCTNGVGHACHAAVDCDGGACGGGGTGVCSIVAGATCHKSLDCDSNSCGTGANGSVKGLCSAGACTTNAQCGTAGTCNLASHVCSAGACSLDTNCGTSGGLCTGATCTSPAACSADASCVASLTCTGAMCGAALACGADATCSSSHLCGGAKCTAKACAIDAACTVGSLCNGAKCSTPAVCAGDAACASSHNCTGSKCSTLACAGDVSCTVGAFCNAAKCSSQTCLSDAACTVGALCNGAKCSTPAACAGDAACTSSHVCTGSKCSTLSCAGDVACTVGALCNGSKCSTPVACAGDAGCTSSHVCNNAKCSTAPSCGADATCASSALCTGAKCSKAICAVDTDCTVAASVCNGAKCSKSTCSGDTDCPTGVCTSATCTPPAACGIAANCGTGGVCSAEHCSANTCASNADCGAGSLCAGTCQVDSCTQNSDCPSGLCNGGTCGCVSTENCGGSQTCNGALTGLCGRACTQNSDCAPDFCVGGQCGGCSNTSQCHDNAFAPTCGGIPAGNYGKCTPFNATRFPEACRQGTLSAQEKSLEFMFFDLTACVSPDNAAPPPPAVRIAGFPAATFTQDFVARCPPQTLPVWKEFDWQAQIPAGTNIVFSAQSGTTAATLLPAMPLLLATATTSTTTGPMMQNFDLAYIDTGPKGTGAFDVASPRVASASLLRVTITLNPTPDFQQTPTLIQWRVQYDCGAAE